MECLPALDNREETATLMNRFASENRDLLVVQAARPTARMRMLLSREGEVAYAEVERSSGQPRLDRHAAELVQRMRFRPASVNGRPVDVWITLPVAVASAPTTGRSGGRGAWPGNP